MKAVFLAMFLAYALETVLVSSKYHNYENFNIDTILSSKEKTQKFVDCMRDDKKCETRADLEFKLDIQEMLSTSCSSCTEKEKVKFQQALEIIAKRAAEEAAQNGA